MDSVNEDKEISPLVAEMVAGMTAFCDVIELGEPVEKHFSIRTMKHHAAARDRLSAPRPIDRFDNRN